MIRANRWLSVCLLVLLFSSIAAPAAAQTVNGHAPPAGTASFDTAPHDVSEAIRVSDWVQVLPSAVISVNETIKVAD